MNDALIRKAAARIDVELGVIYPGNPTGLLTELLNGDVLRKLAEAALACVPPKPCPTCGPIKGTVDGYQHILWDHPDEDRWREP